ncbi:MAG: hypothetical protein ACI8UX_001308 [Psychromonas sp.]|jgi:hypothetical protein
MALLGSVEAQDLHFSYRLVIVNITKSKGKRFIIEFAQAPYRIVLSEDASATYAPPTAGCMIYFSY